MVDYEIENNTNDFLRFNPEYIDQNQLKKAKVWYYNFTGKQYNDDVKELVEIYKVLSET